MGCSAYIVFVLFHKDTAFKNAIKSVGGQREIGSISNRNLKPVLNASAPAMSSYLLKHVLCESFASKSRVLWDLITVVSGQRLSPYG